MGICTGKSDGGASGSRVGTIATLGEGSISTLGEGESSKVMQRGVAWMFFHFDGGVPCRLDAKKFVGLAGRARCGETGWGDRPWGAGVATLEGSGLSTLGCPGAMIRVALRWGGARSRQDLKRSRRLAMASSWEILVGGGAPDIAPATTCNPWMILSSGDCEGTVT